MDTRSRPPPRRPRAPLHGRRLAPLLRAPVAPRARRRSGAGRRGWEGRSRGAGPASCTAELEQACRRRGRWSVGDGGASTVPSPARAAAPRARRTPAAAPSTTRACRHRGRAQAFPRALRLPAPWPRASAHCTSTQAVAGVLRTSGARCSAGGELDLTAQKRRRKRRVQRWPATPLFIALGGGAIVRRSSTRELCGEGSLSSNSLSGDGPSSTGLMTTTCTKATAKEACVEST